MKTVRDIIWNLEDYVYVKNKSDFQKSSFDQVLLFQKVIRVSLNFIALLEYQWSLVQNTIDNQQSGLIWINRESRILRLKFSRDANQKPAKINIGFILEITWKILFEIIGYFLLFSNCRSKRMLSFNFLREQNIISCEIFYCFHMLDSFWLMLTFSSLVVPSSIVSCWKSTFFMTFLAFSNPLIYFNVWMYIN